MTRCNVLGYLNGVIILENGNIEDLISVAGIQMIPRDPKNAKQLLVGIP